MTELSTATLPRRLSATKPGRPGNGAPTPQSHAAPQLACTRCGAVWTPRRGPWSVPGPTGCLERGGWSWIGAGAHLDRGPVVGEEHDTRSRRSGPPVAVGVRDAAE